jgi:hypothetical protein
MKKSIILIVSLILCAAVNAQSGPTENRWKIDPSGSITWIVDGRIPHNDHIEMSGERISTVLRYGVDDGGAFVLERSFVWPMLRTIPNNTHASLMRRWGWDIVGDLMTVNGRRAAGEKVKRVTLDGVMTVVSEFELPRGGKMTLTRSLFPSTKNAAFCEKYVVVNSGEGSFAVGVPDSRSVLKTDPARGVDGGYDIQATVAGFAERTLAPGQEAVWFADFQACKKGEQPTAIDVDGELARRRGLIVELWDNLVLDTPDATINTMFAFAKIRAAESIYNTRGGYMHGPGGESYYAAIWANDQAEYINPFYPFLGYDIGNRSALNAYKHFARFMNDDYRPIPSSIVAEGTDIWDGAGDRGDAAMIAYGVARYAMARGDRAEALELWSLLEWCLEYCRRKVNEDGVVASDSDELEGRFPHGDANLCTSSLYYDALVSAARLGRELGKPASQTSLYTRQATALRAAIEKHFGATVEGFDTYRYYEGNEILRSWICVPLTVGIHDRKEGTIAALFSPRLWTRNGLLTEAGRETFWDRSTLYALRGVFECGETAKAIDYLTYYSNQRLLGEHVPYAIEAWPEGNQRHLSAESGLYCRIVTEGMFGIRPTGLSSFDLTPRLPEGWDRMAIRKLNAFGTTFDIEVTRVSGGMKVEVTSVGRKVKSYTGKEGRTIAVRL